MVHAYYNAYFIHHTLREILGRKVEMEPYVDSISVFDVISKDGNATEKRFKIYIHALLQSYSNE